MTSLEIQSGWILWLRISGWSQEVKASALATSFPDKKHFTRGINSCKKSSQIELPTISTKPAVCRNELLSRSAGSEGREKTSATAIQP